MIPENGLQIVVVTEGFVYVGNVFVNEKWVIVENALNIRRWGTTRGLGELRNGPTEETVLDYVGRLVIPMHALVHFVEVYEDRWIDPLDFYYREAYEQDRKAAKTQETE